MTNSAIGSTQAPRLRGREWMALTWALLVELYFLSGITLTSSAPDERFALGRLILLLSATLLGAITLRLHPRGAQGAFLGATLLALWLLLDIVLTVQVLAAQLLGTAIVVAAGVAVTLVLALALCTFAGVTRARRAGRGTPI